jgi:hypothetical protein
MFAKYIFLCVQFIALLRFLDSVSVERETEKWNLFWFVKVPESATTAPTQSADPRTLQAVAGNGLSPIGTAATSTTPPSANGVNPSASALPPALLALLSQTLPGASNG